MLTSTKLVRVIQSTVYDELPSRRPDRTDCERTFSSEHAFAFSLFQITTEVQNLSVFGFFVNPCVLSLYTLQVLFELTTALQN